MTRFTVLQLPFIFLCLVALLLVALCSVSASLPVPSSSSWWLHSTKCESASPFIHPFSHRRYVACSYGLHYRFLGEISATDELSKLQLLTDHDCSSFLGDPNSPRFWLKCRSKIYPSDNNGNSINDEPYSMSFAPYYFNPVVMDYDPITDSLFHSERVNGVWRSPLNQQTGSWTANQIHPGNNECVDVPSLKVTKNELFISCNPSGTVLVFDGQHRTNLRHTINAAYNTFTYDRRHDQLYAASSSHAYGIARWSRSSGSFVRLISPNRLDIGKLASLLYSSGSIYTFTDSHLYSIQPQDDEMTSWTVKRMEDNECPLPSEIHVDSNRRQLWVHCRNDLYRNWDLKRSSVSDLSSINPSCGGLGNVVFDPIQNREIVLCKIGGIWVRDLSDSRSRPQPLRRLLIPDSALCSGYKPQSISMDPETGRITIQCLKSVELLHPESAQYRVEKVSSICSGLITSVWNVRDRVIYYSCSTERRIAVYDPKTKERRQLDQYPCTMDDFLSGDDMVSSFVSDPFSGQIVISCLFAGTYEIRRSRSLHLVLSSDISASLLVADSATQRFLVSTFDVPLGFFNTTEKNIVGKISSTQCGGVIDSAAHNPFTDEYIVRCGGSLIRFQDRQDRSAISGDSTPFPLFPDGQAPKQLRRRCIDPSDIQFVTSTLSLYIGCQNGIRKYEYRMPRCPAGRSYIPAFPYQPCRLELDAEFEISDADKEQGNWQLFFASKTEVPSPLRITGGSQVTFRLDQSVPKWAAFHLCRNKLGRSCGSQSLPNSPRPLSRSGKRVWIPRRPAELAFGGQETSVRGGRIQVERGY